MAPARMRKTGLKQALDMPDSMRLCDARRDEEKSRARTRIFIRTASRRWGKNQRLKLWNFYNAQNQGRKHSCVSDEQLDGARHLAISPPGKYRNCAALLCCCARLLSATGCAMVDDERFRFAEGEKSEMLIRFRTLVAALTVPLKAVPPCRKLFRKCC